MANIYYHNVSKFKLNLDKEEMLMSYEEGDIVISTERGNAITEFVDHEVILSLKEEEE